MLSGLGGDELFGGYPSFRDLPMWVNSLAFAQRGAWSWARVPSRLRGDVATHTAYEPKAAGLLEYGGSYAGAYLLRRGLFMPWELPVAR